jgi:7-keto-8-aminopelargonate synthetase-like enzyme
VERTYVIWRGRKLIYFGGCDYYRLSSHPLVLEAAEQGLRDYGLNVAASRRTTGNHPLYEMLEKETAQFFRADSAILTSSGYLTNIATAQGLRGSIDLALIDESAHSSLQDAAQYLGCQIEAFEQCDLETVQSLATTAKKSRIALLTDGVFAHDGAIAPLAAYRAALGPAPLLWVDDSHAAGIIGKTVRGMVEFERVGRKNLIQTITYSKAFGSYGGAILCEKTLAARIAEQSAALTGTTPVPLPIANAALAGLRIIGNDFRSGAALNKRLQQNIEMFWREAGLPDPAIAVPIIAIESNDSAALKRRLLREGIYPSLIRYPGGPSDTYFRFAISSEHTPDQISRLAKAIRGVRGE